MEKIKDLLEKAIFHKYIRKEPDGKGGFRYVYEEKEIESRSKIINKKQDIIEMTNINPKQIAKSFKKWLENEGIKYEYIESKSTASSYFKFKKKNSDFDIRISNHTKKNQDKETDLGIDFNLYGDGSSDVSINTAYGYKTEDLKKIISDVERLSSKKNYETIIKESNNFELLDLPKREGILKVLEQIGIEESEYALLYSFVEKWMDFNRTKSEYKSYLENKRQEKVQKNKEVQKQSFTIGDVTVYPQKDKKSFDWEYVYNKEKPQGTAEEVKKWKEDRKEAMKYAKLNSWKIYNQTITKSMEIIEKAKKGSPIGTEKTWGGKLYIKTEKGWKPKAKGGKKNEEESTSKQFSTEILVKQATSATDEQLKAAIKDPEANSELKKVAQEELNKRNKQQDSDDKSNKQFTKEDAYKKLLEAQEKGELELDQDVLDKIQEKLQESKKKKEETVNDESLYEAVLNYVAGDAYDINNPNIKSKEKEEFDKAFKKYSSNVSNEVGVLIRGLEDVGWENLLKFNNLEGKKIEDLKGTILENPGYLSTTKNSDFEDFDDFEPTYIIHFDKGELTDIKGIDVNKVLLKKDNFFKYQEEVILNKNLSMKIDKIEKKNGIVHLKTSFVNKETLDNFRLKQDIINEIDKKLSDMTGFKKITQTYVKQDGKTVVIKMKGDNQYKATSPGFKLESKPYESLVDFKKRIKEELNQSTKIENKEEKLSFAEGKEFKTVKQFYNWNEKRSQLSNLYTKEEVDKMKSNADKYLTKDWSSETSGLKSKIFGFIDDYNFGEIIERYGLSNDKNKKAINAILITQGYAPVVNGLIYNNYNKEDYLYINKNNSSEDSEKFIEIYQKDAKEALAKWTDDQRKAIKNYTGSGYMAIRDVLTESPESKVFSETKIESTKTKIGLIKEAIEQNPLKRNMVLNRRLEIRDNGDNLSTWLNAKVGQVIEDKSFVSFGMKHETDFGSDLQITLLAKKGDPIMNIDNIYESEYLAQAGLKYKVLARGTNSIVVEIV